jgi:hypothetical protein
MKINSNNLATLLGFIAGGSQLVGQSHLINPTTAQTISAWSILLLGVVTNNPNLSTGFKK